MAQPMQGEPATEFCRKRSTCSQLGKLKILKQSQIQTLPLSFSPPETIMKTICNVVLTFESVDEILWCDHSNENSSAVLLHGTIRFSIFHKMKFRIFLGF